jgi:hypothetical protein
VSGKQLREGTKPIRSGRLCGLLRAAAYLPPENPTDLALGYVLAATNGDVGLAADAIRQEPRPAWVAEFFGPGLGLAEQSALAEGVMG